MSPPEETVRSFTERVERMWIEICIEKPPKGWQVYVTKNGRCVRAAYRDCTKDSELVGTFNHEISLADFRAECFHVFDGFFR